MTGTTSLPIRVLLVDNHPVVCRGLATVLMVFDHLELVGQAESGKAAIQLCAEVLPDVILMDMNMSDMDGATITRAILQKLPRVRVIALTSNLDGKLIKRALEAGVIGYLLKDVSADQLVQAICAAASGQATISAEAAQALVEAGNLSPSSSFYLTECEREILALMVDGLNNTQIARQLDVSPVTVKKDVNHILSKLSFVVNTMTVTLVSHGMITNYPSSFHQELETKIPRLKYAANDEYYVHAELDGMRVPG